VPGVKGSGGRYPRRRVRNPRGENGRRHGGARYIIEKALIASASLKTLFGNRANIISRRRTPLINMLYARTLSSARCCPGRTSRPAGYERSAAQDAPKSVLVDIAIDQGGCAGNIQGDDA